MINERRRLNVQNRKVYLIRMLCLIDYLVHVLNKFLSLIALLLLVSFLTYIILYETQLTVDKKIEVLLFLVISSIITYALTINNNRKIIFEIFDTFTSRYDKLNENLNRIFDNKRIKVNGDVPVQADRDYVKKLIIYDYLNLCAEEYYWFKKGVLNFRIWQNWSTAMRYFLKHKDFCSIIIEEQEKDNIIKSYYGFLNSYIVREIINQSGLQEDA